MDIPVRPPPGFVPGQLPTGRSPPAKTLVHDGEAAPAGPPVFPARVDRLDFARSVWKDRTVTQDNPFPGMNPFMERRWRDVHLALIGLIRRRLGLSLPGSYTAMAEEHVSVVGGETCGYYPDVSVIAEPWKRGEPPVWTPAREAAANAPLVFELEVPPERWVEIRHDDGDLVTVIEVVSPTNRDLGRSEFLRKRQDFIEAGVSLVEIDLLREGRRLMDVPSQEYLRRMGTDEHYTVMTIRAGFRHRREIYKCPLRQALPMIKIPLRAPDPDVDLELQPMIDEIYTTGRYWKVDHETPLEPPLCAEDAAWVAERLAAARNDRQPG